MPEYVRIYDDRQGSEYVLNNIIHSTSLLYKLTRTYREISVFRTRSKIYDGRVGQIITVFNYFCEKLHHLKFLKSVLSMCRVLNTSEFWIFIIFLKKKQSSEYAVGCNYGRVLNIPGFHVCHVSVYEIVVQDSE